MKRTGFDAGAAVHARTQAGRATDAFKAGYAAAERAAADIVARQPLPREMKEMGGWTAILFRAFRSAAAGAKVPWLFGQEIAVEALFTAQDTADIRLAAQRKSHR